jgi:hypothetical protein
MSTRKGAPYGDRVEDDGATLIYEGHDVPKSAFSNSPKSVDQPEFLSPGKPTENGKFFKAAQDFKSGRKAADLVRVYEKIRAGVWADNGYFRLVYAWKEHDGARNVFKFRLEAIDAGDEDLGAEEDFDTDPLRTRLIPSHIKQEVWQRDKGQCVVCGAKDELHFDHIVPFSKGGTSLIASNVQLLCVRHNLQKRANIE